MSPDFDGLVETSTSLGEAMTERDRLTLHSLSRSSNDSALPEVIATLDAVARLAGGTLEVKHNYNGWRPDLDSRVLAAARSVYERLFGQPPVVTAVHAGLETAVIGSKVERPLDMLAIGPQIELPHSPDERVSVPTVQRFWKLLVGVVDELSRAGEVGMRRGLLTWIVAARRGSLVSWSPPRSAAATSATRPCRPASGRRASAAPSASGAARSRRSSRTSGRRAPTARRAARSRSRRRRRGGRASSARGSSAPSRRPRRWSRASTTPASPTRRKERRRPGWCPTGPTPRWTSSRTREDSLDEEADSLEESIEQLTGAARAIASMLASGVQTIAEVARLDPELAAALQESSTCQRAARGGEQAMRTTDWILLAVQGLVVIGFIALGVRSGGIGLGLWGGVGTLVLVFVLRARPRRAADERDADHHRRHLGRRRDAGRGRNRLHGQDRERGAPREAEGAQLHRALRLLPADDPHGDEQHLLLDHPRDQRGRVREQDPARAGARRLDRAPRRSGSRRAPSRPRWRRSCRWSRSTATTSSTCS